MSNVLARACGFSCVVLLGLGSAHAQEARRSGSPAEAKVEERLRSQPPGADNRRAWKLEQSRWQADQTRVLQWQSGESTVLLHYRLYESPAVAKAAFKSDVLAINGGPVDRITGFGDEAVATAAGFMFRRGRLTASVSAPDLGMSYQVARWLLAELNREHLGSGDKNDPDLQ